MRRYTFFVTAIPLKEKYQCLLPTLQRKAELQTRAYDKVTPTHKCGGLPAKLFVSVMLVVSE